MVVTSSVIIKISKFMSKCNRKNYDITFTLKYTSEYLFNLRVLNFTFINFLQKQEIN